MPSTSRPETLDFRPALRQTMVITRKSLETGGEISRVEVELEAGQGAPFAHVHPGQREIFTVDAGELVVTIDGQSHVITAGESIEIPNRFRPQVRQSIRQAGAVLGGAPAGAAVRGVRPTRPPDRRR
jgi:mannose-6-phosphate isomerase-like protein (cupin superfamily)